MVKLKHAVHMNECYINISSIRKHRDIIVTDKFLISASYCLLATPPFLTMFDSMFKHFHKDITVAKLFVKVSNTKFMLFFRSILNLNSKVKLSSSS